jgi:prepilin-type N-terminal cleavage/methylation domain-containing protein
MKGGGFTLIEIMIVIAIIGMLAVVAIPFYAKARKSSQTKACINNLKQIDGAKDRYALEQGLTNGDPINMTDIIPYFMKKTADCPAGGSYSIATVGSDPLCSVGGEHTF